MTKKKAEKEPLEDIEILAEIEEQEPPQETHEIDIFVPYITQSWKGKIDVFKCVECGYPSESEDEIILHCVDHLPEADKAAALELLVKE